MIGSPKSVTNRPSSRGVVSSPHTRSQLLHPGELFACAFSASTAKASCKSARPPAEDPDDPTILTERDSIGVSVLKTPHDNKRQDAIVSVADQVHQNNSKRHGTVVCIPEISPHMQVY